MCVCEHVSVCGYAVRCSVPLLHTQAHGAIHCPHLSCVGCSALQDSNNDGDFGTDRHFAAVVCQIWTLLMSQVSKELMMCRAASFGEGFPLMGRSGVVSGYYVHMQLRLELMRDGAALEFTIYKQKPTVV